MAKDVLQTFPMTIEFAGYRISSKISSLLVACGTAKIAGGLHLYSARQVIRLIMNRSQGSYVKGHILEIHRRVSLTIDRT
jgi:hypothetical protein